MKSNDIYFNQLFKGCDNVYIIAEACDNHLGQMDVAIKMIHMAKESGADAIKFQHHLPDEEMLPDVPMSSNFDEPLYDFLKKYALSIEQHKVLKQVCDNAGIQYLCTPFSYKAAVEISEIVPGFKIGSGEMTDIPSLKKIAAFGKPMIISTGMSTYDEIYRTYNILKDKVPIALLNCVSEYPPIYNDLNLGVISEMKNRFGDAIIGHSDHTPDIYTSFAAVALGAKIIEKHVILDKTQPGPDREVSIEFHELAKLVDGVRKIEISLGRKKIIHPKEMEIRKWAFRSVVSTRDIREGEIIKESDLWSKRPGTGIPSYQLENLIGQKTLKNIKKNTLLSWQDIDGGENCLNKKNE